MVLLFRAVVFFLFILMGFSILYVLRFSHNRKAWIPVFIGTIIIFSDYLYVIFVLNKNDPFSSATHVYFLLSAVVALLSGIWGVISLTKVYRELHQANKDLRKSREELVLEHNRMKNYLEIAGVMIVVLDGDGGITLINKKGCEILGYGEEDLIGKNWFDMVIPEDLVSEVKGVFLKIMSGELENTEYYENEVLTKSGERRAIAWHNTLLLTPKGDIVGTISSGEDITDRKASEEKLLQALNERETLLRELHHRTKNNMQVISSLLSLQAGSYDDARLTRAFEEAITRIRAMALVHEKLYSAENFSMIGLRDYVSDLLHLLINSFAPDDVEISVNTDLEDVVLSLEKAIPVGLIINEVVTNSFKHAFKGTDNNFKAEITVSLRDENDIIVLEISDNGVGIPSDFNIYDNKTFGVQTIILLGEEQLNGSVSIGQCGNGNGIKWIIKFKNN